MLSTLDFTLLLLSHDLFIHSAEEKFFQEKLAKVRIIY